MYHLRLIEKTRQSRRDPLYKKRPIIFNIILKIILCIITFLNLLTTYPAVSAENIIKNHTGNNVIYQSYADTFMRNLPQNAINDSNIILAAKYLLSLKLKNPKQSQDILNFLMLKTNHLANSCDLVLQALGKLESKYPYNYIIGHQCRSAEKTGYLLNNTSEKLEIYLKQTANICLGDPDQNGCADNIGYLILARDLSIQTAAQYCLLGRKIDSPQVSFFEGCLGGYLNRFRFTAKAQNLNTIEKAVNFCSGLKNIQLRGYSTCLGNILRTYVRIGLPTNQAKKRFLEFRKYCLANPAFYNTCGMFLGYTINDIFSDQRYPSYLDYKKLPYIINQTCIQDRGNNSPCLEAFVSWYLNQWALNIPGRYQSNIRNLSYICQHLNAPFQQSDCFLYTKKEDLRYKNRIKEINSGG